ncbi:hypothetical protein FRC01_005886 [Tulasnella sp. 417]|nr:hypothetical protein FRC01_005886 [Tulasnella sp. 417]
MAQNAEAQAFLRRLGELPEIPGVNLSPAITPSLQDEADLRRLFATDRDNTRLEDPYVGLVDVFGYNTDRIKKIHARVVKDVEDLGKYHVMPLPQTKRRKDGELSMAPSLEDFKTRWAIFSEGALSQLANWNNVVVAGGSVLACLAPLPDYLARQGSKRAIRRYYHSEAYPASDVDLFLYGLTPAQAEEKCVEIYNAIQDSVPWEVCAVRTKNAVSIHCQYPYRPIQIVLRIYQSPAEILAGFDVDSACVAFDGTRVLAAPRALLALMTQCNRVAMDRRSPSYEVRLAKYAARGFEIHVPDLRREDFDPTIFERALTRVTGLARLLVLEKLSTQDARDQYLTQRRQIRGRPNVSHHQNRRRDKRLRGDLKSAAELPGLQMSDYDVMFHIPYGPGINAQRIRNIVYQTDLGMNSTFNPGNKNRRLHRHPAFFGSMAEALGDCCKYCPLPETNEEKETFEKEQEQFITGRVSFIQDNPGRQSITGSFRPIDSGEWSEQAYLKPLAKLFSYITSNNRLACNEFLKRNADSINARDHLGRTPLQLALLCSVEDICSDLIEQGARMTSRMVDGRCSLHLAAQMGLPRVVKALLEKSEKNKTEKEASEKEAKEEKGDDGDVTMKNYDDEIRDSSEDDWSSQDDDEDDYEEAKKRVDVKGDSATYEEDALDDPEDQADILEIDAPDWDQSLTALGYAIIGGSLLSVQILVAAGADCKTPRTLSHNYGTTSFYPLTLTALTPDESIGAQIAEYLITAGGASCSAADSEMVTVFHRLVSYNKPQIIEAILKVDSTAKVASRFLCARPGQAALHPIVSAFAGGQRAMVAVLLAYAGTRAFIDLETYDRSVAANPDQSGLVYAQPGEEHWRRNTLQPLEASLADYNDLYRLVLALEPESVKNSAPRDVSQYYYNATGSRILGFLQSALREVERRSTKPGVPLQPQVSPTYSSAWRSIFDLSDEEISDQIGWDAHAIGLEKRTKAITESKTKSHPAVQVDTNLTEEEKRAQAASFIPYFQQAVEEVEKAALQNQERDPSNSNATLNANQLLNPVSAIPMVMSTGFPRLGLFGRGPAAPQIDEKTIPFKRYSLFKSESEWEEGYPGTHLIPLYDELYEACWNGDNDKIRVLCLPPKGDSSLPPSGTRDLLQITARVKYVEQTYSYTKGYTPLYVALRARQWNTARLILEIAQEQLAKEDDDEKLKQAKQSENVIAFIDPDDDSDTDSCASGETEKRPLGYTNLVKRFHTVSVKVKPNQLLSYGTKWATECTSGPKASTGLADPITLAVLENDVEAFNQIADMMEALEEPMSIPLQILHTVLATDSPEMLDAFIRRTGYGLCLPRPKVQVSVEDAVQAQRHSSNDDGPKIYLGLDVDGRKRSGFAGHVDLSDHYSAIANNRLPIAWHAASKQATAILEYLSSQKAIDAYRYYAESKKTRLAKHLAEVLENTEDFPQMVGFYISQLGESPVLAVAWNPTEPDRIFATLKKLMELQPRLTADGVRLQIQPNRKSALLLLCTTMASIEAFDWMVANGADPMVRDERGWNILHLLFNSGNPNWAMIEHALAKLPTDTTKTLMTQQSHTQRNTPFAIAVKKNNLRLIELLLRTVKDAVVPTLILRDCTGASPFHTAILKGWSKIVSHLISVGPPEMLYMESGVGSTPTEIARLQFLSQALRGLVNPLIVPNGFTTRGIDNLNLSATPGMRDRDREEVKSLRRVIGRIKSSDALARKPELLKVLSDFADRSELDFAAWEAQKPKEEAQSTRPIPNNEQHLGDVNATFDVLSKAVVEVHQRQLVHLHDVQLAVLTAVERRDRVPVGWDGVTGEAPPDQMQDFIPSVLLGCLDIDSDVTPYN